jgi:predicted DNA-binding transcriptional regulator AlpA
MPSRSYSGVSRQSGDTIKHPTDSQGSNIQHNYGGNGRPERLIGFDELYNRVGLSRTTIWRLERAGEFPRSVRISRGRRAWCEADVSAWIEAKLSSAGEK